MIHESVSIKKKPYLAVTKRYGMSSLHAIRCNKFVLEIQGVVKVESVLVSACGGAYPGKLMIDSERTGSCDTKVTARNGMGTIEI